MRLLDADVCIDLLREHPPTIEWFGALRGAVAIPGIVVMELYQGCRDKKSVSEVGKLLRRFTMAWLTESDYQNALTYFPDLRLSHNLGAFDALIAATAIGLDATICTFNTKHFEAVPNVKTEKPYEK